MNKPSDPSDAEDLLAAYLAEDSGVPGGTDDAGLEAELAAYLQGDSSLGPTAAENEAVESHRKRSVGSSTLFGAASPSWKRSVSKTLKRPGSRPAGRSEAKPAAGGSRPAARSTPKAPSRPVQVPEPIEVPELDDDSVLDLDGFAGGDDDSWTQKPQRPAWLDADSGDHFDSAIELTEAAANPQDEFALDSDPFGDDPDDFGALEFDPGDSVGMAGFDLDPEYERRSDDEVDDDFLFGGNQPLDLDDSEPPLAVPGIVRSESALEARPSAFEATSALESDPAFDQTAAGAFDPEHNIVAPSPFDPNAASDLGDSPNHPPSSPGFETEEEFEDLYAADQLDIAPEYLSGIESTAIRPYAGEDLSDTVNAIVENQLKQIESRLARRLGAAETQQVGELGALATGVSGELAVLPPDWGVSSGPSSRNTRTGRKTRVDFFLNLMRRRDSSQLHLHVGYSPLIRVDDELVPMRFRYILTPDWDRLIQPICPPGKWPMWLQDGDVEFYYDVDGIGRFHVSLFRERTGAAAVFEMIPDSVPSLEALALPSHLERLADLEEGLVLICGVSGSGTSTTTASLVDSINKRTTRHIVTIEDPIDYVYVPRQAVIHQREVGVHVRSFDSAMRAVLRESADVIVLGAVRSPEVVQLALEAVETGTLVLAVVGTRTTAKALERLIDSFPEDERGPVRDRLGDALRVAIAQQLVVTNTGAKAPALEVLLNTIPVAKDIRAGRLDALANHMADNRGLGMISMDQCLFDMWREDVITQEIAYDRCHDRAFIASLFEEEHQRVEAERREMQAELRATQADEEVHSGDETAIPGMDS